ncbi:Fur family transcriptional regulator [Mucisphaera calidilacus]|uniref:Ferric uptake regulation protein n=1 Tax=Mucisphaera calidilacus TaxID=2527982 RepID=A0A518BVJ5_9BACT|nr:transcriptional repressor [Mucisphaera calidilacus]QDU70964.1 Ferric uptake regulation protein [Mucisphaera calidilacus]
MVTTHSHPQYDGDDPLMLAPVCSIFRRFLHDQGLKFTSERAHILDTVLTKTEVFEAEQLLNEMRSSDQKVSKATIYRTLKHLVECQIIEEVLLDPRQTHYQTCIGRPPTGHLMCVESGKIVEFPLEEIRELVNRICDEHGFQHVGHRLVIQGISPEAAQQDRDEAS